METIELTPAEVCARALIEAATSMGTRTLRGAIGSETEAKLRALLDAPRNEPGAEGAS